MSKSRLKNMSKYFLQTRLARVSFLLWLLWAPLALGAVAIRLPFEPPTLDWNLGDVPIHVINNIMEGLYAVDAKGKVVPVEAKAMPRKKGERAFVITLKPSLKWSDGQPVRAADYVYSWNRLRDPRTASTYTYLLNEIENARALSDLEIEVTFRRSGQPPRAHVFTHWATFPMRADAIEKHGSKWTEPENLLVNGRYKIASHKSGDRFVLVPNPKNAHPGRFEKVEALIVADDATALRLYDSGRLDFMSDLGELDRKQFEHRADYHSMRSPVLVYIGVSSNDPLLRDVGLRQSLSATVDRVALVKALGGSHAPTQSILPGRPLSPGPVPTPPAALSGKFLSFGYFEKGGNRTTAEFLQSQWKQKLKLNLDLFPAEIKTYWAKLAKNPLPLFLNTFGPPVWDERYYLELLRSGNPMNMGRWSDAAFDAALDRGDYKQAERIVAKQQPVIPLYFRSYEYLLSPKLKGAAKLNPMTSLYLD